MSSHEFLLAEDTPDPLKYLDFYQNVKAVLREKLAFKDKNSHTISSLKLYSCIYPKYIIFAAKPISGYGDAPHQVNTLNNNMQKNCDIVIQSGSCSIL